MPRPQPGTPTQWPMEVLEQAVERMHADADMVLYGALEELRHHRLEAARRTESVRLAEGDVSPLTRVLREAWERGASARRGWWPSESERDADVVELRYRLAERTETATKAIGEPVGWCPECGLVLRFDEDGCCEDCGQPTLGPSSMQVLAMWRTLRALSVQPEARFSDEGWRLTVARALVLPARPEERP